MDYEKKYKEALEDMRVIYPNLKGDAKLAVEHAFTELRESEDERIRKELIEFIKWSVDRHFMREDFHQAKRPSEWIAYLEKQKEQKPNYCHHEVDETGWTEEYRKAYYDGWNNCNMQHEQLKADQKPAEWSEEDKDNLNNIIWLCENCENGIENVWIPSQATQIKNLIKSLR